MQIVQPDAYHLAAFPAYNRMLDGRLIRCSVIHDNNIDLKIVNKQSLRLLSELRYAIAPTASSSTVFP